MVKKEKWREKLEQFKQDDRYDYLIELLLPYTAGFRAGSLDRGFLPILCEVEELLDRAREEWTEELRQAFYDTFYKSGELWFDYLFEDGDTKAEQNAKEVVEEYWKEIISKLTTK